MAPSPLCETLSYNLSTFRRQPLSEISGSLGDLGTFLPILIALAENHQISLSTTLIFTGIYNIATGLLYGIPLPVQPMKAIAAVALLKNLSAPSISAAGIFVSLCLLLFSVTGLLALFTRTIPIPIVKGIQLGAGFSLVIAAGTSALNKLTFLGPNWTDNHIWLICTFLALALTTLRPTTPFALIALVLGLTLSLTLTLTTHIPLPTPTLWHPHISLPKGSAWATGILTAGLGQLPLTTLNSVIAVVHLSSDLLPHRPTPSATSIGLSVAAMNIIGCPFGAMPACHGSGGLAAQYRFGARSGASVVVLGLVKVVVGLVLGDTLEGLLKNFPTALLTVMVVAAGLELVGVGESLNTEGARDVKSGSRVSGGELSAEERKRRWTVMMVTAGMLVAFKNDGIGFLAGCICYGAYWVEAWLKKRREGSVGDDERTPLLA